MSKLYFFRHAQASYGAKNYDVLSPKGEEQSAILGQYLVDKGFQFDKIFVGPLRRQEHTFEIVKSVYDKNEKHLPEPIFLEELREHVGPKAARIGIPKMVQTVPKMKQWYAEMQENPAITRRNSLLSFQYFMDEWVEGRIEIEGIQSWSEFRKTVKKGLDFILENTGKGETTASFTSGGTISAIAAESLKIVDEKRVANLNFSIRNTSFTSFLYSNNQFNLLSMNELPHLEGEMVTFV